MERRQISIAVLLGAIPTFVQLWIKDMWPVGSWQWGALTFLCLFLGIALMTYGKWLAKNNGGWTINLSAARNAFAWFLGLSSVIWAVWIFHQDWGLDLPSLPMSTRYEEIWVHPDRSQNRVMEDENKCRVDAYEAFGPKPSLYTGYERNFAEYVSACMIGKGYVIKRIKQ